MAEHSDWSGNGPLLGEGGGATIPPSSSAPSFGFEDICYALLRRKWLVLFFSLLGIGGAVALYLSTPRLYHSDAKVMVKYVPELETVGPADGEGQIKPFVLRGETVINSELELFANMDVARQVAKAVGPQRILAALGGGDNLERAAAAVKRGTKAFAAEKNNVITVMFYHPDPTVVQPVVTNLIEQYFVKHFEVHRALAGLDEFNRLRDQIHKQLDEIDTQLLDLKKTNGLFSIDASKTKADERVNKVEESLNDARSELAMREARLKLLQVLAPNQTNEVDLAGREERLEKYTSIATQIERLRKMQQSSLAQGYSEDSVMVRPLRTDIAALEVKRKELEKEDPTLALATDGALGAAGKEVFDPVSEARNIKLLQFKITNLTERLTAARAEEAFVYDKEGKIVELERRKTLLENQLAFFSSGLERAKIESALGAARESNISRVESATPPVLQMAPLFKVMGACAAGGIGLGVGLALFLGLIVDQGVRRPARLRQILSAPLYLTIPKLSRRLKRRALQGQAHPEIGWDSDPELDHRLQPYFEALRDRVLNRFDGLARKPKLVGVCGCGNGQGAHRTAAGLAAALSEAGALKVLLVDMKTGNGSARVSMGSRKACSLLEVLEEQKRPESLVAPNLYMASVQELDNQPTITSPTKFTTVIPQLNASDFDYVVFDMPPVDEVSISPRLAKHMDLTLLVVDAESARRRTVQQAGSLLSEFTRSVAVVLNDAPGDTPNWLQ